ncbi:hypothetical protein ACHAW6_002181 [Cyclotella cf. meneghiniana]
MPWHTVCDSEFTKYFSNPWQEHDQVIIYRNWYMIKTHNLGLSSKPDPSKGFYCFVDADLSGKWNKEFAELDHNTVKSRSSWFILYAIYPVIWCSNFNHRWFCLLQRQTLCDIIHIMALLCEMSEYHFQVICQAPHIYCKAFKDNSGALELVRLPKL